MGAPDRLPTGDSRQPAWRGAHRHLLVVTAAVALAALTLGIAWGPAWVLGAAVAPTDAIAIGALARILPRRNVAILCAESLVNDGTALVLYGVAVVVTVGEQTLSVARVRAHV